MSVALCSRKEGGQELREAAVTHPNSTQSEEGTVGGGRRALSPRRAKVRAPMLTGMCRREDWGSPRSGWRGPLCSIKSQHRLLSGQSGLGAPTGRKRRGRGLRGRLHVQVPTANKGWGRVTTASEISLARVVCSTAYNCLEACSRRCQARAGWCR